MMLLFSNGIRFKVTPAERSGTCSGICLPNVLLLHGWMGSHNDYSIIASELATLGFTVYAPDLPLHGESVNVDAQTLGQAALKLVCAFESLERKSQDVVLCGYSMGGRIVLEMCQFWTKITNGTLNLLCAICISSALPPRSTEEWQERKRNAKTIVESMSALSTPSEFEYWLRSYWYTKSIWGELQDHPLFNRLIESRTVKFSTIQCNAWRSAVENLGASRAKLAYPVTDVPLLYIYGELDEKYSNMSRSYVTLFKSSCRKIAKAAHNVVFESPIAVASNIVSFLLKSPVSCHIRLNIMSVRMYSYANDLTEAMAIGSHIISKREGYLVIVQLKYGHSGISDVSPLPGWHRITIDEAANELEQIASALRYLKICPQCYVSELLIEILPNLSNIVVAAIDAALIQAQSKAMRMELSSFLNLLRYRYGDSSTAVNVLRQIDSTLTHIPINGVLPRPSSTPDSECSLVRIADFISATPFRTIKVKVGIANSAEEDADIVRAAVKLAAQHGKIIRLDANQAWSMEQWCIFRDRIGKVWHLVEFIEEPLLTTRLLDVAIKSGEVPNMVNIGLDESLSQCTLEQISTTIESNVCSAIVIKPSMFRCTSQIFRLVSHAHSKKTKVVISSTFESGVALAWHAHIAASCDNSTNNTFASTCHGLGTFTCLKSDVINPSFQEYCIENHHNQISISLPKCESFLNSCIENLEANVPVHDITGTMNK